MRSKEEKQAIGGEGLACSNITDGLADNLIVQSRPFFITLVGCGELFRDAILSGLHSSIHIGTEE